MSTPRPVKTTPVHPDLGATVLERPEEPGGADIWQLGGLSNPASLVASQTLEDPSATGEVCTDDVTAPAGWTDTTIAASANNAITVRRVWFAAVSCLTSDASTESALRLEHRREAARHA